MAIKNKYVNYLELTEDEKLQADRLFFLLGTGLEDKVFFRTGTGIDAVNTRAVDQVYADTWGFVCFEHRKAFQRGDQACCQGEHIYPMRTQAMAAANLDKLTLRELYLQLQEEDFDIDQAGGRAFQLIAERVDKAMAAAGSGTEWAAVSREVRGNPVRSFKDLYVYCSAFVMTPEQREEAREKVIGLGRELVEREYISQGYFDEVTKGEKP